MFRTLKKNSRLALKGNWTAAILLTLTLLFVFLALGVMEHFALRLFVIEPLSRNPTMEPPPTFSEFVRYLFTYAPVELGITAGFVLLTILLVAPLTMGARNWHYKLVRGENPGYSECFAFFDSARRYGRSLYFFVLINLKAFLWAIPFYLLPTALLGGSVYFYYEFDLTRTQQAYATMGISLAAALFLLASVLYAIFMQRYALAPYLLCEGDLSARAAIMQSVRYSKGYRASYFLFCLSFIGWIVLIPFSFFALLVFVVPYLGASQALYARYIVEKNRQGTSELDKPVLAEGAPPPKDEGETDVRTREFRAPEGTPGTVPPMGVNGPGSTVADPVQSPFAPPRRTEVPGDTIPFPGPGSTAPIQPTASPQPFARPVTTAAPPEPAASEPLPWPKAKPPQNQTVNPTPWTRPEESTGSAAPVTPDAPPQASAPLGTPPGSTGSAPATPPEPERPEPPLV